jgi:hypothetical protein
VGIFVAANIRAYLADFEYVRFLGVFGAGYLKRVPQDVILVQEGISGEDDAPPQGFFFEVPSDDVASCVRCLVGPDAGVGGMLGLRCWSLARKVRSSRRASWSWALESLAVVGSAITANFSVSASS